MNDIALKDQAKTPLRVFCSYAHEDEAALDELRNHLAPLRQIKLLDEWHDRKIPPGGDWDAEISQNLEAADLILLLVSANFVSSTYCTEVETPRALERHYAGEATVIPVFLRECAINDLPFIKVQGTPRDIGWINQQVFRDKAWTEVVEAIRAAALLRLPPEVDTEGSPSEVIEEAVTVYHGSFGGSPKHNLSAQTGHTYVADSGVGSKQPVFLSRALLYLLMGVVLFAVAWFGWQWGFVKDSHVQTGEMFLAQGEYQQARNHCVAASASHFRNDCLAITNIALNDVKSREAFLRAARDSKSVYAQVLLGDFRAADFDGTSNPGVLVLAEKHYVKALQINPNLPAVYFGQGLIRHLQNKLDEAVALYQQALNMAPENGRFALNLATANADNGAYAEAEKLLHKSLATNPEVIMAHAELIEVLVLQGKMAEAQRAARYLQALLLREKESVICQAVNMSEWFILQEGEPRFLSSWLSAKAASWAEKMAYLDHYIFPLASVAPVQLPPPKCQVAEAS